MRKTIEKRHKIELQLYARGKRRIPSVSIIAVDHEEGLLGSEGEEFTKFSKACHEFCKHLIDVGEL